MLASARRAVDIQHPTSGPVVAAIANLSRHLHSAAWWCVECRCLSRPFLSALKSHSSSELVSHSTLLVSAPTRILPSPPLETYYHFLVQSLSCFGFFFVSYFIQSAKFIFNFSFWEKVSLLFFGFRFDFIALSAWLLVPFSPDCDEKGNRNDSFLLADGKNSFSIFESGSFDLSECDFSSWNQATTRRNRWIDATVCVATLTSAAAVPLLPPASCPSKCVSNKENRSTSFSRNPRWLSIHSYCKGLPILASARYWRNSSSTRIYRELPLLLPWPRPTLTRRHTRSSRRRRRHLRLTRHYPVPHPAYPSDRSG